MAAKKSWLDTTVDIPEMAHRMHMMQTYLLKKEIEQAFNPELNATYADMEILPRDVMALTNETTYLFWYAVRVTLHDIFPENAEAIMDLFTGEMQDSFPETTDTSRLAEYEIAAMDRGPLPGPGDCPFYNKTLLAGARVAALKIFGPEKRPRYRERNLNILTGKLHAYQTAITSFLDDYTIVD